MAERGAYTKRKRANPGQPIRSSNSDSIIACDLFAGAGGFSLGAYLAGIEVAAAVEMNENACNTYRSNLISTGLTTTHLFECPPRCKRASSLPV